MRWKELSQFLAIVAAVSIFGAIEYGRSLDRKAFGEVRAYFEAELRDSKNRQDRLTDTLDKLNRVLDKIIARSP